MLLYLLVVTICYDTVLVTEAAGGGRRICLLAGRVQSTTEGEQRWEWLMVGARAWGGLPTFGSITQHRWDQKLGLDFKLQGDPQQPTSSGWAPTP